MVLFVMIFPKQSADNDFTAVSALRARFISQWLRYSIDYTVDPCKDFYKYVCSSFRGENVFRHVATAIDVATLTDLISAEFPASNQLSWQKAAAMYQSCMSFTSSYRTETSDLVNWMKSLNLDLLNKDTLATVNPVEMMVRGSLDLGVEAVISITFRTKAFWFGRRLMEMDYSKQQDIWQAQKNGLNVYVLYLAAFGATSSFVYELASKLLEDIAKGTRVLKHIIDVFDLSVQTAPYVSSDDWDTFLRKYTNDTYSKDEVIHCLLDVGTLLAKLFESKSVGKEGLQYLVAWTFYRQLYEFTDPVWFVAGRSASDACYEHIKKVMKVAITSHHFQSVVPPRMVYQTKRMVSQIRNAFDEALRSSSWLTPKLRALASGKLINITVYVGSPGRRLDPDYIEELYKPYPDVPLDRLFPTWIKYLSLNTHLSWSDQNTVLYDDTDVKHLFLASRRKCRCTDSHDASSVLVPWSQEEALYDGHFPEHGPQDGRKRDSTNLTLTFLLAVGLGLCCSMVLLVVIFSRQSADTDFTKLDTLAFLHVPKTSAPSVTSPSGTTSSHFKNTSVTFPDRGHLIPSTGLGENLCTGSLCRFLAEWLRYSIDYTVDPCQDFYKYVCASFRGTDTLKHVENAIEISSLTDLLIAEFPSSNQLSWQKAAALYQSCMSFTSAYRTETSDLVNWMKSLDLNLLDKHTLATVNPVEMMVRGSLDLGVEAVISLTFHNRAFAFGKRLMQMDYSKQQSIWQSEKHGLNDYVLFLASFGATSYFVYDLASRLRGYENHLDDIAGATHTSQQQIVKFIYELSRRTLPYVSEGDWDTFISKYTNYTYSASDKFVSRLDIGTLLAKLFASKSVGKEGLQYLVAWTFYRQLFEFTVPIYFLKGRSANDVCYEHVKKLMKLAIASHHFQSVVSPRLVYQTRRMASRIRTSFEEALQSSSWLTAEIRALAINRLIGITVHVGSPGRRLDPDYVEEVYKHFPDVPLDRLFPTWIKYLSLYTHLSWSDQKPLLYDETSIIAHEFMHAFDVANTYPNYWKAKNFKEEYTKRAVCLRRSHKSVLSLTRGDEVDDTKDSENVCDLVGTAVAYAAYSSLPDKFKIETLSGLNASSEQLFFISHCLTLCAQLSRPARRYAPFRSRCIVPLMNMPEFSSAFGCAAGTPMNPRNKCKFW
ncbi:hypothetical protein MTO96_023078 [Rhipicephalus appendiculatus]